MKFLQKTLGQMILIGSFLSVTAVAEEVERKWILGKDREVLDAEFVGLKSGNVTLKVKGKVKTCKLSDLSGHDKTWVLNHLRKSGEYQDGERVWKGGFKKFSPPSNLKILSEEDLKKRSKYFGRLHYLREGLYDACIYPMHFSHYENAHLAVRRRDHLAIALDDNTLEKTFPSEVKVWSEILGKDRIEVYPATGLVVFYKSGKVLKNTSVVDRKIY